MATSSQRPRKAASEALRSPALEHWGTDINPEWQGLRTADNRFAGVTVQDMAVGEEILPYEHHNALSDAWDNTHGIKAYVDGQPAGNVTYHVFEGDYVFISWMYVEEDYRGTGVFRAMIDHLYDRFSLPLSGEITDPQLEAYVERRNTELPNVDPDNPWNAKIASMEKLGASVEDLARETYEDIMGYEPDPIGVPMDDVGDPTVDRGHKPPRADIQKMKDVYDLWKRTTAENLYPGNDQPEAKQEWQDKYTLDEEEATTLQMYMTQSSYHEAFERTVALYQQYKPLASEDVAKKAVGQALKKYEQQHYPQMYENIRANLNNAFDREPESYKLWPRLVTWIKEEFKDWMIHNNTVPNKLDHNPSNISDGPNNIGHLTDVVTEGGKILSQLRAENRLPQNMDVNKQTPEEFEEWLMEWKRENRESEAQGEVVYEFKDGSTIQRLTTPEQLQFEGDTMGHCVGSSQYADEINSGSAIIYSLRDAKGTPHVTMEVEGSPILKELTEAEIESHYQYQDEYSDKMLMLTKLPTREDFHDYQGMTNSFHHSWEDQTLEHNDKIRGDISQRWGGPGYFYKGYADPHDEGEHYTTLGGAAVPWDREFEVIQIMGNSNNTPKPEYQRKVKEFLDHLREAGNKFKRSANWYAAYDDPRGTEGENRHHMEAEYGHKFQSDWDEWADDYKSNQDMYTTGGEDDYGMTAPPTQISTNGLESIIMNFVGAFTNDYDRDHWSSRHWESYAQEFYHWYCLYSFDTYNRSRDNESQIEHGKHNAMKTLVQAIEQARGELEKWHMNNMDHVDDQEYEEKWRDMYPDQPVPEQDGWMHEDDNLDVRDEVWWEAEEAYMGDSLKFLSYLENLVGHDSTGDGDYVPGIVGVMHPYDLPGTRGRQWGANMGLPSYEDTLSDSSQREWKPEQNGNLAIPGTLSHKTATTVYHIADPAARESILQHGLNWELSDEDDRVPRADEDMWPMGNYFYSEFPEHSGGFDVWAVDADGLSLEDDPANEHSMDDNPNDLVSYDPVPPQYLKLVTSAWNAKTAADDWEWGKDYWSVPVLYNPNGKYEVGGAFNEHSEMDNATDYDYHQFRINIMHEEDGLSVSPALPNWEDYPGDEWDGKIPPDIEREIQQEAVYNVLEAEQRPSLGDGSFKTAATVRRLPVLYNDTQVFVGQPGDHHPQVWTKAGLGTEDDFHEGYRSHGKGFPWKQADMMVSVDNGEIDAMQLNQGVDRMPPELETEARRQATHAVQETLGWWENDTGSVYNWFPNPEGQDAFGLKLGAMSRFDIRQEDHFVGPNAEFLDNMLEGMQYFIKETGIEPIIYNAYDVDEQAIGCVVFFELPAEIAAGVADGREEPCVWVEWIWTDDKYRQTPLFLDLAIIAKQYADQRGLPVKAYYANDKLEKTVNRYMQRAASVLGFQLVGRHRWVNDMLRRTVDPNKPVPFYDGTPSGHPAHMPTAWMQRYPHAALKAKEVQKQDVDEEYKKGAIYDALLEDQPMMTESRLRGLAEFMMKYDYSRVELDRLDMTQNPLQQQLDLSQTIEPPPEPEWEQLTLSKYEGEAAGMYGAEPGAAEYAIELQQEGLTYDEIYNRILALYKEKYPNAPEGVAEDRAAGYAGIEWRQQSLDLKTANELDVRRCPVLWGRGTVYVGTPGESHTDVARRNALEGNEWKQGDANVLIEKGRVADISVHGVPTQFRDQVTQRILKDTGMDSHTGQPLYGWDLITPIEWEPPKHENIQVLQTRVDYGHRGLEDRIPYVYHKPSDKLYLGERGAYHPGLQDAAEWNDAIPINYTDEGDSTQDWIYGAVQTRASDGAILHTVYGDDDARGGDVRGKGYEHDYIPRLEQLIGLPVNPNLNPDEGWSRWYRDPSMKTAMAFSPEMWQHTLDNIPIAYHVTDRSNLSNIMTQGIMPASEHGKPRDRGYWTPRPGHVYLFSNADHAYESGRWNDLAERAGDPVMIEIDLTKLDPTKFKADEDYAKLYSEGTHADYDLEDDRLHPDENTILDPTLQNIYGYPNPPQGWPDGEMSEGGAWIQYNDPPDSQNLGEWAQEVGLDKPDITDDSWARGGTIAYEGTISPTAIVKVYDAEGVVKIAMGLHGDLTDSLDITEEAGTAPTTRSFIARQDGAFMGMMTIEPNPDEYVKQVLNRDEWVITYIQVSTPFQRMGVATALLNKARESYNIIHHQKKTDAGAAWAQHVGMGLMGDLPPNLEIEDQQFAYYRVWNAKVDGQLIGSLNVSQWTGLDPIIENISVEPSWKRRGIATALINQAELDLGKKKIQHDWDAQSLEGREWAQKVDPEGLKGYYEDNGIEWAHDPAAQRLEAEMAQKTGMAPLPPEWIPKLRDSIRSKAQEMGVTVHWVVPGFQQTVDEITWGAQAAYQKVRIPWFEDDIGYLVAMHELGHHAVGHMEWGSPWPDQDQEVEDEAQAWRWAIENSEINVTQEMLDQAKWTWEEYREAARGVAPADEHEFGEHTNWFRQYKASWEKTAGTTLYHATGTDNLETVMRDGLRAMPSYIPDDLNEDDDTTENRLYLFQTPEDAKRFGEWYRSGGGQRGVDVWQVNVPTDIPVFVDKRPYNYDWEDEDEGGAHELRPLYVKVNIPAQNIRRLENYSPAPEGQEYLPPEWSQAINEGEQAGQWQPVMAKTADFSIPNMQYMAFYYGNHDFFFGNDFGPKVCAEQHAALDPQMTPEQKQAMPWQGNVVTMYDPKLKVAEMAPPRTDVKLWPSEFTPAQIKTIKGHVDMFFNDYEVHEDAGRLAKTAADVWDEDIGEYLDEEYFDETGRDDPRKLILKNHPDEVALAKDLQTRGTELGWASEQILQRLKRKYPDEPDWSLKNITNKIVSKDWRGYDLTQSLWQERLPVDEIWMMNR